MLAIRLQRTGRKGHAQFRLVVQDSHVSPKSGKVVAQLGSYDPHTKATSLDKEKASFYLEHGAQPSERMVSILQKEGVKLPKWVAPLVKKEGKIRSAEKLRKNQPAKPVEETAPEASESAVAEETAPEAPEASESAVAEETAPEATEAPESAKVEEIAPEAVESAA